jgi:hypothetical protein
VSSDWKIYSSIQGYRFNYTSTIAPLTANPPVISSSSSLQTPQPKPQSINGTSESKRSECMRANLSVPVSPNHLAATKNPNPRHGQLIRLVSVWSVILSAKLSNTPAQPNLQTGLTVTHWCCCTTCPEPIKMQCMQLMLCLDSTA